RDVCLVVAGRAGAHLDAGLAEADREHGGGGELAAVRLAGVLPRPGGELLGDGAQAGELLGGIGDEPGRAVHHRAAVVHRVAEHRAGVDDPVEVGDGQADRGAVGDPQPAGAGGAVDVDGVVDAAVAGGQHDGGAVADEPDVADQPRVEHGVQVGPVGAGAFAVPGQGRAGGRREAHTPIVRREVAS